MTQQAAATTTFSEKLRFLFGAVRHPSGREYNVTEVTEAINARGLHQVSRGYISALREGTKPTPSAECVAAIADFFGVPPAYFHDDVVARWVHEEIRLVATLRNSPVRHISMEAFGLSESSLHVLADTIKHLRRLEGLPESSEEPDRRRRRRWRKRDETQGSGPAQGNTASAG